MGTKSRAGGRENSLERGRWVLSMIQSRQAALQLQLAAEELQWAIREAEAGNDSQLLGWLQQNEAKWQAAHSDFASHPPDTCHRASPIPGLRLASWFPTAGSPDVERLFIAGESPLPPPVLPSAILEGPTGEALEELGNPRSTLLPASSNEPAQLPAPDATSLPSPETKATASSPSRPSPPRSPADHPQASALDRATAVSTPLADRRTKAPPKAGPLGSASPDQAGSKVKVQRPNSVAPIAVPSRLPQAPAQGKPPPAEASTTEDPPRKNKLLLAAYPASSQRVPFKLSPSLLGSGLAHLLIVFAMSCYAFRLAMPPEPKAIVASAVDTQQVSMETPVELPPVDPETLEIEQPTPPQLPSFSDAAVAASTEQVELPPGLLGLPASDLPMTATSSLPLVTTPTVADTLSRHPSVQFFGVQATGNTFCYLVDASPSMKRDNAFAAAKSELVRSLAQLKAKQRFYICFFGGDLTLLTLDGAAPEPFPVYATPENLQKTLAWIDKVKIQSEGKAPTVALEKAISLEPDGVFLLFDGDTRIDVPAFLRKANRSQDLIAGDQPRVPIHTIGFYDATHAGLMKQIAEENSGTFRFIPNPQQPRKP